MVNRTITGAGRDQMLRMVPCGPRPGRWRRAWASSRPVSLAEPGGGMHRTVPPANADVMKHAARDLTALIVAARDGDEAAFSTLYDRLYDELHRLARVVRAGRGSPTLNTTALVHEAYIKLVPGRGFAATDRLHFLRIAARAMRQVLVDAARRRRTREAGRVLLEVDAGTGPDPLSTDILMLDAALTRLEQLNPRQASVVECRFFAGLTVQDTAAALDISEPTVKRDWRVARAWLAEAIAPAPGV